MRGINKVILVGNLGRDPELRHTKTGVAVANLSIATSETWSDKDGSKQERTEWHRIVLWDKLAEIAEKYLSKGRQVYLEGRLQTRVWKDNNGDKRYTTEIRGDQLVMLGGKGDSQPREFGTAAADEQPAQSQEPFQANDDDVPF